MTSQVLSRLSKLAPDPWHVNHGAGNQNIPILVGYTCHMAAMHWAQMALGANQQRANEIVGVFSRLHCPRCNGRPTPHGSVWPGDYGKDFCRIARQIPNRNDLHSMVNVGDILFTGHFTSPVHTMVVRQKRGQDHITVRGFNNSGTLGTGQRNRYDPVSHNITKDKYWKAAGKFGIIGEPLFVVKHDHFMAASRLLRDEVARTAR